VPEGLNTGALSGAKASSRTRDNYVLETRVKQFQNCKIKPEGVIYNKEYNKIGNLHFDTQLKNVLLEEEV
jgi:hypothetical protein